MLERFRPIASERLPGQRQTPALSDVHELLQVHLVERLALGRSHSDERVSDCGGPGGHIVSSRP